MTHLIIHRTLWHETEEGRKSISQAELLGREEPMVVLGEAGMGKTELLGWLGGQQGHVYCTARQLLNVRPGPKEFMGAAHTLVVDALDELSTRAEGDAVDLVLQKLGDAGYPRFVLACRVADWRDATGTAAIAEQYARTKLLVLHLEPLSRGETRRILTAELDGNEDASDVVIEHFENLGLGGLISNPQTLELVARVAKTGPLPTTKARLFEESVALLRKEHNKGKASIQPDEATALDSAGAAFAALILTGSEALVLETADPNDGELVSTEVVALPGASRLGAVLGSRLFGTVGGPSRFSYWHRRIGEYLGARWLARQATTAMQRRRLLSIFHSHEVVPASLRGLHAWLAHHSSELLPAVVAADPIGVLEYGDADTLDPLQASLLLQALKTQSQRNPDLYIDSGLTVRCLVQPSLLEEVRAIVKDRSGAFFLQHLLVDALAGSSLANSLRDELRSLMLDKTVAFSTRRRAVKAVADLGEENWPSILEQLRGATSDEEGRRLALEIVDIIGFSSFEDSLLAALAITQAISEERSLDGRLHKLAECIPKNRRESFLDELVVQIRKIHKGALEYHGRSELADLTYHLIAMRLETGGVAARNLWRWMSHLDGHHGYDQRSQSEIAEHLLRNIDLRRSVQRLALLDDEEDEEKSIHSRNWRLTTQSRGFQLSEKDVVALLNELDASDKNDLRWRDVLILIAHSPTTGGVAREVAKKFAWHRQRLLVWIDRLAQPRKPKWLIKNENRERQLLEKQEFQLREDRQNFARQIDSVRQGMYTCVIDPAQTFLGSFAVAKTDTTPRERLIDWLGPEIADAAIEGFEAFLQSDQPPTAKQMADAHAESRQWNAGPIIVAGLLARFQFGRAFAGVSNDRLIAGYWEARRYDKKRVGDGFHAAIELELHVRGLLVQAARLWIEPQLEKTLAQVDGLWGVLTSLLSEASAAELGLDWLARFPDMAASPESMIVDRLLALRKFDQLRPFIAQGLARPLTEGRRGIWESLAFVIDFDATGSGTFSKDCLDPELLWNIRAQVRPDYGRAMALPLSVQQMKTLVIEFRGIYPFVPQPTGVTGGDRNPWDAAHFLGDIANRLADMTSAEAVDALAVLVHAPHDGYTAYLRRLASEQKRKRCEEQYQPTTLAELQAIACSQAPRSIPDLQATLLELLEQVQKRIYADPADPWRGFYANSDTPQLEERCRDHLLTMLGVRPESIDLIKEGHLAADKRADIIASLNGMRLPIEVKGQWHSDIWHAADTQLDRFYTTDYAAERRGIYLVFWFGNNVPEARMPRSKGRGHRRPKTPSELKQGLEEMSPSVKEGRVSVVVLDLERPPRIPSGEHA